MRRFFARAAVWLTSLPAPRLLVLMVAVFGLSRLLYGLAGVRFDATTLGYVWQLLDPVLLRTRLGESLWYLHAQPPLLNLFVGAVLALVPAHALLVFQVSYLLLGLAGYLMLFRLMRVLGVGRPVALVVSTVFAVGPAFVLYENWLFYTLPLAVLLLGSALALHAFLVRGGLGRAFAFFASLFLVAGIRSLFHLAWFVLLAILLVVLAPASQRRAAALAALLPLLLLTGLYVKNQVVFGRFTVTTWLGMNLYGTTARNLRPAEREALVARGALSPVALVDRFSPLEFYPPGCVRFDPHRYVPALDDRTKSNATVNFNHRAFIAISEQYLRDDLASLRLRPDAFLVGSARSWFAYFVSASDYFWLESNLRHVRAMAALYDYALAGKVPFNLTRLGFLPIYSGRTHYLYLFLLVGLPAVFVWGVRCGLGRSRLGRPDRPARLTVLYLCFTILYVALFGNILEVSENNRFRFMTDPFTVALLGLAIQRLLDRPRGET